MKLQEFKKRAGFKNFEDLARAIGVKKSTVDAWSAGVRTPTYEMCVKLLDAGMTVEELFDKPYISSVKESHQEFDSQVENAMKRMFARIGKF